MHPAALSIKAFGAYVVITGVGLILVPNLLLGPLGVPATTEIWVRVLGALAVVLGYYYWACGVAQATSFFRATIKGRILFAVLCGALVAAFNAPLQLLLFGAVDLAGAAWTWQAMRAASEA